MRSNRVWCGVLLLVNVLSAQGDVHAKLQELLRNKDDADPKLVEAIALAGTREAATGLLQAYDVCTTLLLRRTILRELQRFATVPDAEQPVLERLAALVADPDLEAELRPLAIDGLAASPKLGKSLLQKLVDGQLPDPVREASLRAWLRVATADDAAWLRQLWNLKQEQRKNGKGEVMPLELNTIRQLAVQGLLPFTAEAELTEAIRREYDPKIRRAILLHMEKQSMPKTAEIADWLLDRVDVPGADRAVAARILFDRQADKAATRFTELAKKRDVTPEDLRAAMATLIADKRDAAIDKRMAKLIGKGKPHEKVFALLATARIDDPKLVALVQKGLADDSIEVRRACAAVLAQRRCKEALPELRKLLASKQAGDARIAFDAITAIATDDEAWRKELGTYAAHADRELRNAAIESLGAARDKRQLQPLLAALRHDDWSTRLAAVEALQQLRDPAAVPELVARLAVDSERLRLRIGEALWQLTAQPLPPEPGPWTAWWEIAKADFKVATEAELNKAEAAREQKRLTARTVSRPKFFGLQVESQRVLFVLDVSGSMTASMEGRYVGKHGASRIDVAKQQLSATIEGLAPGTLFNIFVFSSGVDRWQPGGIGVATAPDRKAALTWVERLGASGGTNLHDALKLAFDDPDVDTIFVMSDGEPTAGALIDPHRIREEVAFWNKHRKVVVNTIAVGGNLEVLEWLARDSGGKYVQMR
ncbi:MAG: HEAT repeat domain-containing protein [Planctomycetes bacterium]|nr:HEAT repeat domain-containing protein [Planctomycetota bacterium]